MVLVTCAQYSSELEKRPEWLVNMCELLWHVPPNASQEGITKYLHSNLSGHCKAPGDVPGSKTNYLETSCLS